MVSRDGTLIAGEVSRFSPGAQTFQVDGSKGSIRYDGTTDLLEFYEKRVTDHQRPVAEFDRITIPASFVKRRDTNEFHYFIKCLRRNVPPRPDFEYGLGIQRLLDALDRSARENKVVRP